MCGKNVLKPSALKVRRLEDSAWPPTPLVLVAFLQHETLVCHSAELKRNILCSTMEQKDWLGVDVERN